MPEVAKLLGISQQRVRQLVDDDPEYPEPARVERRGRWVRKYSDYFGPVLNRAARLMSAGQWFGTPSECGPMIWALIRLSYLPVVASVTRTPSRQPVNVCREVTQNSFPSGSRITVHLSGFSSDGGS